MKKKSKRTLTPKLRFPEFRKEPGWKDVPLEQIAERTTTKNLDGSIARVLTNSAEHGILDQRDYFDKDIANAGNIDGYYIVDLGDYVYNPRISTLAPVGPISRNDIGKGVMSPLYTVFRFAEENTDFYQYYFKTASWHFYLRRVSSMGARHDRMSITTGDFMAMPVPAPPAREQQKIAECLSSLDGLIAAEDRKLEALKAHKKGLMQRLFPQPGQTQPRLRFPEFDGDGDWEEEEFGNLLQIYSGKGFKASEYSHSGVQLLQIENVGYGSVKWSDIKVYLPESYIDKYPELVLREGDVVLALNRPITNNELKIAQLRECDEPSLLYQRVGKVVRTSSLITDEYVLQLCQTIVKSFVLQKSIGSDQPFISLRELYDQKVVFPSPTEQQRIAACLTTIDTQINAQAEKIESLKQHKRGLMQQLFPAPEEQ